MNYAEISKSYKPECIKILLIGEAPPHNGSYFYKIPEKYPLMDTSMPVTIFNHYFGIKPKDQIEYKNFLDCLKSRGIFLIDIINENLQIKKRGQPFNKGNINKLLSSENLSDLKCRIKKLTNKATKIVFLLPTGRPYIGKIQKEFPNSSFVNWKCFRLDILEAAVCENINNP